MICHECKGDGYTYDNPEDMSKVSRSVGGTFQPAWVCWMCNGEGSIAMITIDKEMLAVELANEKAENLGINTDLRYNSVKDNELWNEWYAHYVEMIEEQEV